MFLLGSIDRISVVDNSTCCLFNCKEVNQTAPEIFKLDLRRVFSTFLFRFRGIMAMDRWSVHVCSHILHLFYLLARSF